MLSDNTVDFCIPKIPTDRKTAIENTMKKIICFLFSIDLPLCAVLPDCIFGTTIFLFNYSLFGIFTYKLAVKVFVIKNIYFEAIIFILFLYSVKIQLRNNAVDLILGSANP